jgi:hypothetical protein
MTKIKITFIPNYMIETGEGRRSFPTWATEMSVFYHYGMDWLYLQDWKDWTVVVSVS